MPPAHICQGLISLVGIGKPVEGLPAIGEQAAERIVSGQAHADTVAIFGIFRNCDQIMWVTEHETLYSVHADVDFWRLLRPNNR